MEATIQGLGFTVWGLLFRFQGLGYKVKGFGCPSSWKGTRLRVSEFRGVGCRC